MDATEMVKEIEDLADKVKVQLNLSFDAKSVNFIDGFIERQRANFTSDQHQGLVSSLGSFLGKCIITNYGGRWDVDPETQAVCVSFDNGNKVFPFAKTSKQFANGPEDSVYSFYTAIPIVFKIRSLESTKDIDRSLPVTESGSVKPWWKLW